MWHILDDTGQHFHEFLKIPPLHNIYTIIYEIRHTINHMAANMPIFRNLQTWSARHIQILFGGLAESG